MQRVQRQMDEIILDTDFNAIDWSRWGMPPLPKPVTPALKQNSMRVYHAISEYPCGIQTAAAWQRDVMACESLAKFSAEV